jgi:hypothetical protein
VDDGTGTHDMDNAYVSCVCSLLYDEDKALMENHFRLAYTGKAGSTTGVEKPLYHLVAFSVDENNQPYEWRWITMMGFEDWTAIYQTLDWMQQDINEDILDLNAPMPGVRPENVSSVDLT